MTFLRRALPVALPLALVSALIVPSVSHATLVGSAAEDLTIEVPSPMGAPLDGSPSLVSAPDGTYIAWARVPGNPAVTTWSAILLSRTTRAGVDHSPPDFPLADSYLYDTAVAFDGMNEIVVYTHGSSSFTGSQLALWNPSLGRTQQSLMIAGRTLDLSVAPFVDHNTIPIVVAFTAGTGGTGFESERIMLTCDGSYGLCMGTGSMYDTIHFDGRAWQNAGDGRFFMSRANGGDADLQTSVGTTLVSVSNGYRVVDEFFGRDTGEFVTLTASGSNTLLVSLIDASMAVHSLVADPVTTTSGIIELALAPDRRGGPAWFGALEDAQIEIFAQDLATSMLESVVLPVPSRYGHCQRFHIANYAADPDLLAVVAQCVDNMSTYGHVLYWTVRRAPMTAEDAGADVIDVDVEEDAAPESGVDAGPAVDVAMAVDAGADDVAVDSAPSVDIAQIQPGTGPSFRGSGCSCTVPGPSRSRAGYGAAAGIAAIAFAASRPRRRGQLARRPQARRRTGE